MHNAHITVHNDYDYLPPLWQDFKMGDAADNKKSEQPNVINNKKSNTEAVDKLF